MPSSAHRDAVVLRRSSRKHMRRLLFHSVISLGLAANYFAFQVELFDEEYEQNHPAHSGGLAFVASSLTWESFDKENAPQAIVFDAGLRMEFLFPYPGLPAEHARPDPQYQPVRDKSPPVDPPYSVNTL